MLLEGAHELRKKSHKVVDLIWRNFYLLNQSFSKIYRQSPPLNRVIIHSDRAVTRDYTDRLK